MLKPDDVIASSGPLDMIISGGGVEPTSMFVVWRSQKTGVEGRQIASATYPENGLIERYESSFRGECVKDTLFSKLIGARTAIRSWWQNCNRHCPHSGLGNIMPDKCAAKSKQDEKGA